MFLSRCLFRQLIPSQQAHLKYVDNSADAACLRMMDMAVLSTHVSSPWPTTLIMHAFCLILQCPRFFQGLVQMSMWINRLAKLLLYLSTEMRKDVGILTFDGDVLGTERFVESIRQYRRVPEGFADVVVDCGNPFFSKENIHRRLHMKV